MIKGQLVIPYNNHATIALADTYFLEGQYYNFQCTALSETNDVFSSPAACIIPYSTMKTSQQGRSFPVSYRLPSLCPSAKVCSVSSTSVLLTSYDRQPRTMAVAYVVWRLGRFWGLTDQ